MKLKKKKNGFWHLKDHKGEHIVSPSGYYKLKRKTDIPSSSTLIMLYGQGVVMEKKRAKLSVSRYPLSLDLLGWLTDGKHQLCLVKSKTKTKKKGTKKKVVKKAAKKKVVKKAAKKKVVKKGDASTLPLSPDTLCYTTSGKHYLCLGEPKTKKKAAKKKAVKKVDASTVQPTFFTELTTYEKGFVTRARRDREVYRLAQEANLHHKIGSKQWCALHDRKKAIQKGRIKMPRIHSEYRLTNGDLCAVAVLGWSTAQKEKLAGRRWPGFLNNAVVREWPKSCRKILNEKGWV